MPMKNDFSGWLTTTDRFFGEEWLEELHEALAIALQVMVGLHVLAAIAESWKQRQNLVLSMITGDKPGTLDEAASRNARALGVTLAAAVLGFWAWSLSGSGITVVSPAHAEDAEHPGVAADDENDDD